MAEEIAFENGRISNFEVLVTLTLDRVILHTVVYHSSTSTYTPNFNEIKETFCRRTDVRTYRHLPPALLGRLCRRVDLENTVNSVNKVKLLQSVQNFLYNKVHFICAELLRFSRSLLPYCTYDQGF